MYYFEKDTNTYIVEELGSFSPGQGKKLVEKFASLIGLNKLVRFSIIEPETIKTPADQGALQHVEKTGKSLEIINPAALPRSQLPPHFF